MKNDKVIRVTGTAKIAKKIEKFNEPFLGSHISNEGKNPSGYICPLGLPTHRISSNSERIMCETSVNWYGITQVIVISQAQGMYGIYCMHRSTRVRSGLRAECNKCHASWVRVFYIPWAQLLWICSEDNKILKKKEETIVHHMKQPHKAAQL